jgi:hypothetical protein
LLVFCYSIKGSFIGDAIYVSTSDFKYYAGNSNDLKPNGAIICESSLYGLRNDNINLIENMRTIAFTKEGYKNKILLSILVLIVYFLVKVLYKFNFH